jgi:hypothetical protein
VSPLEQALDALDTAIRNSTPFVDAFRQSHALAERRYCGEAEFLEKVASYKPALAAKMAAQHAEALEIAERLEETLSAGQDADAVRLARRFLAIVQHNIIEEERDVRPLFGP